MSTPARNVIIPPGFRELLQQFAISVFKENPEDVVDFAVDYFTTLQRQSGKTRASDAVSPSSDATPTSSLDHHNHTAESDDEEEPMVPPPRKSAPRRVAVAGESFDPEDDDDDGAQEISKHPKSDDQRARLNVAVKHILLFRCLDDEQMDDVIDAMFERSVVPDECVIVQGDDGDNFYVIESGEYEIFVKMDGVDTKVGVYDGKGSFGELALMYNAPRAATIKATTAGTLWAMDRVTFRWLVLKKAFKKRVMYEGLLESVPLLKELSPYERTNVADALKTQTYEEGADIIKQGDEGTEMFFIEEGEVSVIIHRDGLEAVVNELKTGGYFGELALLTSNPRVATVRAMCKTKVAVLDVGSFERLLGPCLDIMKRNAADYEQMIEAAGLPPETIET